MAATDSEVSRGSDADRHGSPDRRQQPPRRRAVARRRRAPAEPPAAGEPETAATAPRGGRTRGLAAMPFAVSMILHTIVMLVMALVFTISAIRQEPALPITASLADDEPLESMEPVEIERLPDQEFDEPALDAAVDPGEIAIGDVMVAGDPVADVSEIAAAGPAGDLGSLDGLDLGTGLGGEGDGAFTDQTVPLLTAPHPRRTVVNTFGMQVDPKGEAQLTAIAGANRVDVERAAVRAAQANPIKRNTTRGPVWGLTLPQK